jgi:hypothetical protein
MPALPISRWALAPVFTELTAANAVRLMVFGEALHKTHTKSKGYTVSFKPPSNDSVTRFMLIGFVVFGFTTNIPYVVPVNGDEGMYLMNDLPVETLKDRYGFTVDQEWADHLRLSSVRFNSGGSGSFISSNGLVLTNHHVASDTLQKLSSGDRDLIRDGFLAKSLDKELKAPDLELNQLVSIEDVTDKVNAGVDLVAAPEDAFKQRRAAIAKIEHASTEETGLRSDVVTLFGGAKYHLYRYRKFTDVRLVWAPETAAAFFGGDADNFEYPRYNLDATIMRVYEDGKPAKLDHFLSWSDKAPADGDFVFVSGHPGRTQRIFTTAALTYLRDVRLPYVLDFLRRKEVLMQQFSLGGVEEKRRARDELFGIQNSRKAYVGMLQGLQDPATIAAKREREQKLLAEVREREDLKSLQAPWEEVAAVQEEKKKMLKQTISLRSDLYHLAETIVLLAAENKKPNQERLSEFTDSGRDSLLQTILSEAPLYRDLELTKLADELARIAELRGSDDPLLVKILAGRGPRDRAAELIAGTKIDNVPFRKSLVDGGKDAIDSSQDSLVELARLLESEYRRIRELNEKIDERERQAYAKITEATNAVRGTGGYPDATFTLRLAFGVVKGYEQDGERIEPGTTFAGAFAHADKHKGQDDFELPKSWYNAKSELDLGTQLNFVCTADIIGGNSGSPVVNRAGELVGLIFDGNIQSLTSDYLYTDAQGRAVSVSAVGIREALKSIYDAGSLASQLGK